MLFRSAEEAGIGDLRGSLDGQLAVITGRQDISAAAKAVKKFQGKLKRPKLKFGYLDNSRLESAELEALADLPPLEILRATLLGTLQAPAQNLVRLLNTPATQLAQVLKSWQEKQSASEAA